MSQFHTKTPWFVAANIGDATWIGSSEGSNGDRYIAKLFGPDREANARLIAAAPAMLAALKDITDFLRQSGYDTRLVREVIAAAEPTP